MRIPDFQRPLTTSHATLPLVCALTLAVWLMSPHVDGAALFAGSDYGLWRLVPAFVLQGMWGKIGGLALAALCIYAMAELNNSNVLLRISSRMLSSTLAFLLMTCFFPHVAQPGQLLMLFTLLSFFSLFATYQIASTMFAFSAVLMLSVSSLVFPKMLYLLPVYWLMLSHLRALTFRSFVATVLALLLPYWFYGGLALSFGWTEAFIEHMQSLAQVAPIDYTLISPPVAARALLVMLLFLVGTIDFYVHSFLDKTRIRALFKAVIIHGSGLILFMFLQPNYLSVLLPLLLADASIMYGHFFVLTNNRFSRIFNIVLLIATVALTVWNH